ncbi:TPA: TetR/AcrR family transcriptional regulator [Pseudomonas putida]
MSRTRGRPGLGEGLALDDILAAAFAQLDESGRQGLTMRGVATRLGVTPMSLYHHVENRAALLRSMAEQVYAQVLDDSDDTLPGRAQVRSLLMRYVEAVLRYPQLTLAIFTEPQAFDGLAQQITERLTALLTTLTAQPLLWRDILVDHAHGCGVALALSAPLGDNTAALAAYGQALDRLLAQPLD